MADVERLAAVEAELAKLVKERDGLRQALGDPQLVTWIAERGPVPRRLSTFEVATVKRLAALEQKIEPLEDEQDDLLDDIVCSLASGGDPDDPEVLLRAALVTLNLMHKASMSTPESRAMLRALLRYLKSLAVDDDD